ncbi:MAG TPA: hypothetical protein VFU00_04290, partial [Gemmatimonadales bacterium]|nr:hypothetical protein [Gemmatimonadales bacterium]
GVVLSRGRRRDGRGDGAGAVRPARLALGFTAAYATAMALSGIAARRIVRAELERRNGLPVDRVMLSPRFATPFQRTAVAAQGDQYVVGRFGWLATPRLEPGSIRSYPRGRPRHPAVDAAAASTVGRRFLGWARFPSYRVESRGGNGFTVHIVDLRYAERTGVSFGSVSIPVTLAGSPAAGAEPGAPPGAD